MSRMLLGYTNCDYEVCANQVYQLLLLHSSHSVDPGNIIICPGKPSLAQTGMGNSDLSWKNRKIVYEL